MYLYIYLFILKNSLYLYTSFHWTYWIPTFFRLTSLRRNFTVNFQTLKFITCKRCHFRELVTLRCSLYAINTSIEPDFFSKQITIINYRISFSYHPCIWTKMIDLPFISATSLICQTLNRKLSFGAWKHIIRNWLHRSSGSSSFMRGARISNPIYTLFFCESLVTFLTAWEIIFLKNWYLDWPFWTLIPTLIHIQLKR